MTDTITAPGATAAPAAPTATAMALVDLVRGHGRTGPDRCACKTEMAPFDYDRHLADVILAAGYTPAPSPDSAAYEQRWNAAIDWLLNRYTIDPDIQEPFWAFVDGHLSRAELDTITTTPARKPASTANRDSTDD